MSKSMTIVPPAKVAVIGLGNMGQPMAACLSRAGYQVAGFDLSADARRKFTAAGGAAASTAEEAVSGAAAVITLLPDGKIVRAAIESMKQHFSLGTIIIDMSSSAPIGTSRWARSWSGLASIHRRAVSGGLSEPSTVRLRL